MSGYTLDASALRRIGEQTRKAELRPTDLRQDHAQQKMPAGTVARFRLVTPLETGKFAAARKLVLEATSVAGEYEWLPSEQEAPVFAGAPGWNNHWPEGSDVTCVATAVGWLVTTDQQCGVLPGDDDWEPCPYAVLRISELSPRHRDTLQLGLPGTGDTETWDDDYVVLGAEVPPNTTEDPLPGERTSPGLRTVGCTPFLGQPVKIAYQPFDGTLANGQPIPDSVLASMNQAPHPGVGELWGPTRRGKLARAVTILEIFWWELCSPQWECRTFVVPNPHAADPPTITQDYWALPEACGPLFGGSGSSGIPCSQPMPGRRTGFWIAPSGWWALGAWNWGWWGGVGWWQYPSGWWGTPGYGFYDGYFWGPWGYGWWNQRWGGKPPTRDDLLELPGDEPPPDPPCGGVLRRTRYGFIVWEYGWRVLGADPDHEVCTVLGEFEYRNRLIVEHPDVPESACDGSYGGGY